MVTDHGWLLLPGGLPKVELSPHLVATKWSRCAAVKGGSTPNIPTYPWYWNPVLRSPRRPASAAFVANTEYAHGGVSLQECVIPDLIVERGEEALLPTITEISWRGMRCRVRCEDQRHRSSGRLAAELETGGVEHRGGAKEVGTERRSEPRCLGRQTRRCGGIGCRLDASGRVLDSKPTTVGEDA